MPTGFGDLKIFHGSAHPQLAREIADYLGITEGQARLRRFADTEVSFQTDENIRGTDVLSSSPVPAPGGSIRPSWNDHDDAFRRSSAARTAVIRPSPAGKTTKQPRGAVAPTGSEGSRRGRHNRVLTWTTQGADQGSSISVDHC